MTNLPDGVTGREYAIAGPDYERDIEDAPCPRCDSSQITEYGYRRWAGRFCRECGAEWEAEPEWCCDAGPLGHIGRHWREP